MNIRNLVFEKLSILICISIGVFYVSCKSESPTSNTDNTNIIKTEEVSIIDNTDPKSIKDRLTKPTATSELTNLRQRIDQLYANGDYKLKFAKRSLERRDLQNYDASLKTLEDVINHLDNQKNAAKLYDYAVSLLPEDQQKMFYPKDKYLAQMEKSKGTLEYLFKIRKLEKELEELTY